MVHRRVITVLLILVLSLVGTFGSPPHQALALTRSQNIALVPDQFGRTNNGGTLPTTIFNQPGAPAGYNPSFTNVTPNSIATGSASVLSAYDTVVLVGICDIGAFLNPAGGFGPNFKANIETFVTNGGKLIIWDSECTNTDYSRFVYPFTTSNPGAAGATGTLTDVEENSLSSSVPTNSSYVNVVAVSTGTDAVGDANVFVTFNQNWCTDLRARNTLGVNGPVQTYARLGSGLIIYNGLDKDYMNFQSALANNFDPASTNGQVHLQRIWLLQLLQPFNPDNLPCGVKVFGLVLTPKTATNPAGTSHTVNAHVTTNASPTQGVTVTFTVVAGPNTGKTGTAVTDANGDAKFTYTSNGSPGTDTIKATATLTGTGGVLTPVNDVATKTWTQVEQPITASGTSFSGTEGQPLVNQTVATFFDPDPMSTAAEYTATIAWGDGGSSPPPPVTITQTASSPTGNSFEVRGDHTYTEEGTYTLTVTITDIDTPSNNAMVSSTAKIGDAPLTARCATPPFSTQTFNGPTATFVDANPFAPKTDFSATITWGDGSMATVGTISGPPSGPGPYTVSGSHTYASTGTFTITTKINDVGGSSATVSCNVTIFAFATGKGAAFVIGDLEAGLGNHVTWWSSQWANINLMSGGNPPDAMKGFAGFEDNFLGLPPPNCGGTWSTDPGNSTPPPPSVPQVMGVIVSSKVTKSGSVITGDIKQVVIVDNDPGYQPNPGHPGTGREIGILCATP
jgi:hypothetical protein